jgi:hypothetical protein
MVLTIKDNQKLSEVKDEFNSRFPYLKLEFFRHKHGVNQSNPKSDMLSADLTFEKVRRKHTEGAIVVKENMSVADLEQLFQDIFGISAQVFRKSGRSWIETSVTDDWSLERQNDEGKELSNLAG